MRENENFLMAVGKATGWQIELDNFRRGTGAYWVPDPAYGQTVAQLQAGKNLCNSTANGIESRLGDFKENSNTGPMKELITLLRQKAFLYDQAISAATAQPLPEPTTPTPDDEWPLPDGSGSDGTDDGTGTEKEGPLEFIKANPVPFAIAGVLLLNFLLPKKKRFIKF